MDLILEGFVKSAATAGEIMLSNGAETSRIEDTVARILIACGFDSVDAFVVPSGIFISAIKSGDVVTIVRRVKLRTFNLAKICAVNDLSRRLAQGHISRDDIADILVDIDNTPPYPLFVKTLAISVACFSFTYMFGGNIFSSLCAFAISLIAFLFNLFLGKKIVSSVLCTVITASLITFVASVAAYFFTEIQMDKVIIGGIMQLVPGLGLTNGIRDAFNGDYMSASSRLLDAVLIAVSIAVGVGVGLRLWMFFV